MIRHISYLIVMLLLSVSLNAQKVKIKLDKTHFKDSKNYRLAKKSIRKGKHLYKNGTYKSYLDALGYFKKAFELEHQNPALNYMLGMSLLKSKPKSEALKYFKLAYAENKTIAKDLIFQLARAYHLNYKFDEAIEKYNEYKNTLTSEELGAENDIITKRISECRYGKQYVKDSARVFVTKIPGINSSYDDFAPVVPPNGKSMYYTSNRPYKKHDKVYKNTGLFHENCFSAIKNKRKWEDKGPLSKKINVKDNNAVVGLSPNGMDLIMFEGAEENGNLARVHQKKGKWKAAKDNEYKVVNSDFKESSATIAYDNRTLYFTSNTDDEDAIGGLDIYKATRKKNNRKWKNIENVGATLNSKYDENGVNLSPSGQVIYFSSKGFTSMGGYDLFESEKQPDGTWSTPKNLGYPINTPGDDLFFSITGNGRYGYYASQGKNGSDFDIYEIIFLGPEKPLIQSSEDMLIASIAKPITETVIEKSVEIKTIRLTIVKGKIFDAITGDPIKAVIEVSDIDADSVIMTSESTEDGKYQVSLPSGKNYALTIKAKDYLFYSENFNIPKATNYQEIVRDIQLNKLAAGAKVILSNIFFKYGKTELESISFPELNRVVELLNAYPKLKIEISGHTDNKGSLAINKKISKKRAKAVVDYLVSKGIDPLRLSYKGYAYLQPVASNDTEEGRQRNRRVEFKIISK